MKYFAPLTISAISDLQIVFLPRKTILAKYLQMVFLLRKRMMAKMQRIKMATPAIAQGITSFNSIVLECFSTSNVYNVHNGRGSID